MELIVKDLNWNVCLIYLDNIIVYSAGFYPALDRLKMIWRCIWEANLKLKLTKCSLIRAQGPGPVSRAYSESSGCWSGPCQDGSRGEMANTG